MNHTFWISLLALALVAATVIFARRIRARETPQRIARPAGPGHAMRVAARAAAAEAASPSWLDYPFTAAPEEVAKPVAVSAGEAARMRIRDRYIGARFPGVASNMADLADDWKVIKTARLYLEDGLRRRAVELLDSAVESHPAVESLWLARHELAFLMRDAEAFHQCARGFCREHPRSDAWPEVRELGRALGLGGGLFQDLGIRDPAPGHYGPWPTLPNWLQGPWDLTAELRLADLRRALLAVPPRFVLAARQEAA
jgi:hypothetical protein